MKATPLAIAAAGALGAACAVAALTDRAPYPYAQRRLHLSSGPAASSPSSTCSSPAAGW
jgi:hypothetical protein